MKKAIFIFLVIIFFVILQSSIFPVCFSGGNAPDAFLVLSIAAVAVFGFQSIWIWIIIAGAILDIFSFSPVGLNVVSLIFFSYCASFFSKRVILGEKEGGILVGIIFISLVTFFHNLWINLFVFEFKLSKIWDIKFIFLENIGWKIIFNLILFFILVLIFKTIKKKVYSPSNLFSRK